ncbi:unnamed protein product [Pedinophyceae sp. YPF-701]|nr:unnamed protein product [Pedinophyceae sp. YPF-701]
MRMVWPAWRGAAAGRHARVALGSAVEGGCRRGTSASTVARALAAETRYAENPVAGKKFDYIIVGGGAAGCVLANRLTASGDKSVLLLEAGPDKTDAREVKTPAAITRLFRSPLDWNLYTAPQAPLGGREIYLARGKLLGGSSATNATLYMRGSPEDYDGWNLDGWSAKDVLPWFMRSERNSRGAGTYHSASGEMSVEDPRYEPPLTKFSFGALADAGMPHNPDFNDWSRPQEGWGTFQVCQDRGQRADTSRVFLKPVQDRPNLTVVSSAPATRVVMDGTTAVGVEFVMPELSGRTRLAAELAPGGEVLMAAGAIHSPHILQHSGIGPADLLQSKDIPVVADAPAVGENLQDHPACLSAFRITQPGLTVIEEIYSQKGSLKPTAILNYLLRRRGPLTSTGCERGAFVKTDASLPLPDLQMRIVAGLALDPDGVGSYARFAHMASSGKDAEWPPGITFQIIAVRPESRGSVRVASGDPLDHPELDLGYLKDPRDFATLKAGLEMSRELVKQPSLAGMTGEEVWPAQGTDVEDYIKNTIHSANAVVGTCRMGTDPRESVVSPDGLRVHGVSGLRVVDSSVMPRIPGGQTGAPTIMIAERAAGMIRDGR